MESGQGLVEICKTMNIGGNSFGASGEAGVWCTLP